MHVFPAHGPIQQSTNGPHGLQGLPGRHGAPESTVESVPRTPDKDVRKEHKTPYTWDIISAGDALGEVIVLELCVVRCSESQTCGRSDKNM